MPLCWAPWERRIETQRGGLETVCTKSEHCPHSEIEAAVGNALERGEQTVRLGLWKRRRTVRFSDSGTWGPWQVSEQKVRLLSLPEKSRLTRRRAEKRPRWADWATAPRALLTNWPALADDSPNAGLDPKLNKGPAASGQGSEAGKHWAASQTRFCRDVSENLL